MNTHRLQWKNRFAHTSPSQIALLKVKHDAEEKINKVVFRCETCRSRGPRPSLQETWRVQWAHWAHSFLTRALAQSWRVLAKRDTGIRALIHTKTKNRRRIEESKKSQLVLISKETKSVNSSLNVQIAQHFLSNRNCILHFFQKTNCPSF